MEVAAASWALPRWVVVMVGHRAGTQVCPHQLRVAELQEDRDIQDFPHPVAVGRGAQNKLSPRNRGPGRESAEVRGKISEFFFILTRAGGL